jgi:hypothetical protein
LVAFKVQLFHRAEEVYDFSWKLRGDAKFLEADR